MKGFLGRMNPTLRGFLLIGLVVLAVMMLNLYVALATVEMLLRIAFFLAIAFFLYLVWRDRLRGEIETWPKRARFAFYGGVAGVVADLAVAFWPGRPALAGVNALMLLAILVLGGLAMWRSWREQRTYA